MTNHDLVVRPAAPEDRQPVLDFCARTWDDGDYIHEVWDHWFADPHSDLLVGLLNGQPVGLVHVTVEDGDGWLEGLRVAPELRGRGLSHTLLHGGVESARRRAATALRLLAEQSNAHMAAILPRHGFEQCFTTAWFSAPAQADVTTQFVDIHEPGLDALQALEAASLLQETGGLYADGWSFVPFTPARFQRHLERDQIVQVPDAGYAIVMPDGEGDQPAVALASGNVERLLVVLRSHPLARAHGDLRIFLPIDGPLAQTAQRAGYQPRPHRFGVWTLEV